MQGVIRLSVMAPFKQPKFWIIRVKPNSNAKNILFYKDIFY